MIRERKDFWNCKKDFRLIPALHKQCLAETQGIFCCFFSCGFHYFLSAGIPLNFWKLQIKKEALFDKTMMI
jgi:hypothetical protein